MKYLWLLIWIAFIIAGSIVGTIVPDNWVYITGFICGCFSTILLKLYDIERERENK